MCTRNPSLIRLSLSLVGKPWRVGDLTLRHLPTFILIKKITFYLFYNERLVCAVDKTLCFIHGKLWYKLNNDYSCAASIHQTFIRGKRTRSHSRPHRTLEGKKFHLNISELLKRIPNLPIRLLKF